MVDSRLDLSQLHPKRFEGLVKVLFTAMGMESWETQASHDEGLDAIALNHDPILGGLCVIQAKRSRRLVAPDSVRALAGVIEDKRATKGILATNSYSGPESMRFADRNGRIQLIDGVQLAHELKKHLGLEVLLGVDNPPPAWRRRDDRG